MIDTLEEYNEGTRWEARSTSVIRDGHIKIATMTAAQIDNYDGQVNSTTEILIGVFGSTDKLDQFAVWDAKDNLADRKRFRDIIEVFLHQTPIHI